MEPEGSASFFECKIRLNALLSFFIYCVIGIVWEERRDYVKGTSIVAGALSSTLDSRELTYGQYSSRSVSHLPEMGGVGKIPLVIHHQHRLPTCTGEAGASLRAITHFQQTGRIVDFPAL